MGAQIMIIAITVGEANLTAPNMIHMMIVAIKATIAIIGVKNIETIVTDQNMEENTEVNMAMAQIMIVITVIMDLAEENMILIMILKAIMIRTITQTFMMILIPKPEIINIKKFKRNSKLIWQIRPHPRIQTIRPMIQTK